MFLFFFASLSTGFWHLNPNRTALCERMWLSRRQTDGGKKNKRRRRRSMTGCSEGSEFKSLFIRPDQSAFVFFLFVLFCFSRSCQGMKKQTNERQVGGGRAVEDLGGRGNSGGERQQRKNNKRFTFWQHIWQISPPGGRFVSPRVEPRPPPPHPPHPLER